MALNIRILTDFGEINNSNNFYNIIFKNEELALQESAFSWIIDMINHGTISTETKFIYKYNMFRIFCQKEDKDNSFGTTVMSINESEAVDVNVVLHEFELFRQILNSNPLIDSDITVDLRQYLQNDNY